MTHLKKAKVKKTNTSNINGINININGLTAIVASYLDKAEYYYLPNRTLARLIYSEHKEECKSVENIRGCIRSLKGLAGEDKKKYNYCGGKYYVKETDNEIKFISPLSLSKERQPFYLPLNKRIGCLFDVHVPFHDNKALDIAVNYMLKNNVKIVLMQEMFDFYWQSKYMKDLRKPPFKEQREAYIDFMYELIDWFPKGTEFYYQEANHDERWHNWLAVKCQELLGIEYFGVENVFEYNKMGIRYIKDKTLVRAGKLNIVHGHEFRGMGGVNPSRWLFLKTGDNVMCGHFHRTSQHTETQSISGIIKSCWSVGTLGELTPDFMVYNNWNHGCAIIDTESDGNFEVRNLRIYNGKIF